MFHIKNKVFIFLESMTWCHLCNESIEEEFYIEHLRAYHPTTLFVLYAVNLTPEEMRYMSDIPFYMDDDYHYDNDGEYESLLNLCNEIGDHKIGIENINDVIQIVDKDSLDDSCPICLEKFVDIECDIFALKVCSHKYCEECITTWCKDNKICPICKNDLKT
jgi:hypothetical protein